MWFKRKPKNRRLGREQVLDVKLRSSQVRAARTRMAARRPGRRLCAPSSACICSGARGEWALNRLVYENKAFAIQEIDVQTDGVISVDQLRRWAGVKPGENLLALDLARVKRDLELVPLVQSVSVERILPRTLRIRVTEREPIAQVNVPRPRPGGGRRGGRVSAGRGWLGHAAAGPAPARHAAQPAGEPLPVIARHQRQRAAARPAHRRPASPGGPAT